MNLRYYDLNLTNAQELKGIRDHRVTCPRDAHVLAQTVACANAYHGLVL